jgi:hypothetical protein
MGAEAVSDLDYINRHYGLACRIGQRVRHTPPGQPPREGFIVGTNGAHLRIVLDQPETRPKFSASFHPTWHMEYLDGDEEATGV